jgi:lysocardiolipin and lysophospholipid acyltransferase
MIWRSLRAAGVCTYFATLTLSLNALQLLSMPFYPLAPDSVLRFNSLLAALVWRQMITLFEYDGGKIIYTSDTHPESSIKDIPRDESAIVVSNHSSFTDFYLLLSLARRKRMLSRSKYFAKESLKYMPIFGWYSLDSSLLLQGFMAHGNDLDSQELDE